jgi:hypothetical protein
MIKADEDLENNNNNTSKSSGGDFNKELANRRALSKSTMIVSEKN